ncbi:hypothetical protein B5807_06619 [Epicoccum nigrum]|uniref:Uncharacterized protein n=1 Tax=Epicoccum nigrum TaxID=105696 RepID=A0A1Y2LW29_EPING|nr:hypothetical protein B5807_06619 [Epicoccum nigrum]
MLMRLIPQAVPHSIRVTITAQRNIKLQKLIPTLLACFLFFFANESPCRSASCTCQYMIRTNFPLFKVLLFNDAQGAGNFPASIKYLSWAQGNQCLCRFATRSL